MFFLLLSLLLPPSLASAKVKCRPVWSEDGSFFGGDCDSMGIRNSAGRTVAALGEIMRVNPAVLPTIPTPLGAELNLHNRGYGPQESASEVHLVKGLPWLGLGAGTWNTGSMVGSDLPAIFEGSPQEAEFRAYERAPITRKGYRAGFSFKLPLVSTGIVRARAGYTIGSGKVSGENGDGYGGVLDVGMFYFSYSKMTEKFGGTLNSLDTNTYSLGVDAGALHAGYAHAIVRSGGLFPASQFFSLRYSGELWTLFASLKMYTTFRGSRESWPSATVHRAFGDHFTFGYLYGLYRESHSLSLQVFL